MRTAESIASWISGCWTDAFDYRGGHPILVKPKDDDGCPRGMDESKAEYMELYDSIMSNPFYRFDFDLRLYRWSRQDAYGDSMPAIIGATPILDVAETHFYGQDKDKGGCCMFVIDWPAGWPVAMQVTGLYSEAILPPFEFKVTSVRTASPADVPAYQCVQLRPTRLLNIEFDGDILKAKAHHGVPLSGIHDPKCREILDDIRDTIINIVRHMQDKIGLANQADYLFMHALYNDLLMRLIQTPKMHLKALRNTVRGVHTFVTTVLSGSKQDASIVISNILHTALEHAKKLGDMSDLSMPYKVIVRESRVVQDEQYIDTDTQEPDFEFDSDFDEVQGAQ